MTVHAPRGRQNPRAGKRFAAVLFCCATAFPALAQPLPPVAASEPASVPIPMPAPAAAAVPVPTTNVSCSPDGGPANRPPIGLVLSGGGARGYAHLGVLKVLEDNRIPVDCIAATSMGAVVGGLYASGMHAAEMEKRLSQINLADIAFDVTNRADLPQSQREDEQVYADALTIGFGTKGVKTPAGLVQGNRLQALLANWTAAVPANQPFDQLPIPYRAIATDLRTGQMVVLDHGSLPLAIRASMALPGLFAPADIDGRTLVDGGLVSNLPVDTARAMGAKVVIAVDIGSQLRPLDALASPADVMQQMIGILIRQNVSAQRAQLGADDVLLQPALGALSFTDFQTASQAISAGAAAATAALPKLLQYQLTPEQYAAYEAAHTLPPQEPVRITSIDVRMNGPVPKRVVTDALHIHPGDIYDAKSVSQDLLTLTTSGNFESVSQQVVNDGDSHKLVIDAREKYWGPNFLLFGLGVSSSSSDVGGFRLHVGYRRPWLTQSGLEFRADTTLGSDLQSAHVDLRQPLTERGGYYVAPYAEIERRYANLYDDSGEVKVNQYRLRTQRVGIDFGVPIGRLGDFRVGLAYAHGTAAPNFVAPIGVYDAATDDSDLIFFNPYPNITSQALTARARLVIDQLDDHLFPRRGYFTEVRVERSLATSTTTTYDLFGSDTDNTPYTEVRGKAMIAQQFGRHSISAGIEAGKTFGGGTQNAFNSFDFTLGGFQHLAAYAADQLNGDALVYGQVTYMNQLMTFNASPIKALYLGASAEIGNVWSSGARVGGGALKQSYTLFTSLTTSFGPLYIGIALAPAGRRNLYFQLGRTY
ncbi:patatin-like phospholipase family protein [Burkholderia sp. FERM BP-3421]|uniref:patatin-like phospholipase family protein n=1 Tax=Burkholderia sp. FERM BP-3421 TaxID=1494466 RepID=UPI00279FA60A|nr:patatin-like phospholipase family protein [Burkholderia sp. FERM BP-3421]